MPWAALVGAAAAGAALAGCTPALDWRQVPTAESVTALFPCRVERRSRPSVPLAGLQVPMTQIACSAQGMTFAVTHARLPAGAPSEPALREWATVGGANLGAAVQELAPVALRGIAQPAAHGRVQGTTPEGATVIHETLHFAAGGSVFQASVLGSSLRRDAVDTFFDGIELKR
jgi:hypothetical protein